LCALSWLQDHPKDVEFLNTPIRFYTEMKTIFGSSMATGKFVVGSCEALGTNYAESVAAKIEGTTFTTTPDLKQATTKVGDGIKATDVMTPSVGGKIKRPLFMEDEMLMMINMTDVVNNVTNALRETDPANVDPTLYLAVMEMPAYTTEALIVAYTYLLENKSLATGFISMSASHKDIWLRTYLAKNYYE
jgi:hypothetical protein